MKNENAAWFRRGIKNGVPIGLGYFAVSFTLGIAAKNAGLTACQGAAASALTLASAGQFAGFQVMASLGTYLEMAVMMLVINARYLLMSCSLSQKLEPNLPLHHRLLIGWGITDEIFGVASCVDGTLNPYYHYGMMAAAVPGWTLGTFLGITVGNILPANVVSALGVGLYGMFLAIIIPPGRKNRVIAGLVIVSMAASWIMAHVSLFSGISGGMRTIILTVVIAGIAAVAFPIPKEAESDDA